MSRPPADGASFLFPVSSRRDAVLSPEHEQLRWFPLAEVPALRMPDGYKRSIRSWARALGAPGRG